MNICLKKFRSATSTLALVAASSFAASAAYAQPADSGGIETVTVTGIIGSLSRAIDIKRASSAIVDTVSAEDVGKFPDNNVAELLQRITGVEITRDGNGEGQFVTVRGLPTDFSLVTVNGMSASSIAGSSATRTRSFDFSVISPDFISGLEVYKSGRADLDEGGIGANVDVQTVTPFGIGKERIVLSAKAQGEPGVYDNQTLPDLTALYSNTFANNTLGITAGVDWNQRFAPNEQYTNAAFGTYCISPVTPCSLANTHMNFQNILLQNNPTSLRTASGYTSLQWKPVDSTVITLDGLYAARLQNQTGQAFIEVPQAPYSASGNLYTGTTPLQYQTIDANNVLTTLANPNNWMVDRSQINRIYDETENVSLQATTTLSNFEVTEKGQYSRSGTTVDNLTPQVGAGSFWLPRTVTGGYQFIPGAPVPSFIFDPTFNYADPNAWGNDEATYAGARSKNRVASGQVDATYTFDDGGILESVKGGLKLIDQSLPTTTFSWYYNNQSAQNAGVKTPFATAVTPSKAAQNILAGYDGPGQRLTNMFFINPALWLQQYFGGNEANLINSPYTANQTTSPRTLVIEDSRSAYLLANFKYDNSLLPIHGNIGFRWIDTTASVSGNGFDLSAVEYDPSCPHGTKCILVVPTTSFVTRHGGYQKLLPSLNLIGDIRDDMQVRFAYSKTMTRPTLGNLPQAPNVSSVANTISTGNPALQPFFSTNYDGSFEWYFAPASVFSFAVYEKDMTNFIQNISSNYPVATQNTNNGTTPAVPAGFTNFVLTEPLNSKTAYVRGAEIDYKQVFDFLPDFWSGFGAEVNATYSQGQTDAYTAPANGSIAAINVPAQPFAGLTNLTWNTTLFYEKYGISGLITWNHRGHFTASSTGVTPAGLPVNGNKSLLTFTRARDEVDAQASYNINDNYKVFAEASNLLNTPFINYAQIAGISTQYQTGWLLNGRKVSIGVTATW